LALEDFDEHWLLATERALSMHIGPLAKILVRRAAKTARDDSDMLGMLVGEIEDPGARAKFEAEFHRTLARAPMSLGDDPPTVPRAGPSRISASVLLQAERDLADVVGPIAHILVRRIAPQATTKHDLYRLLSQEIEDPVERNKFLLLDR